MRGAVVCQTYRNITSSVSPIIHDIANARGNAAPSMCRHAMRGITSIINGRVATGATSDRYRRFRVLTLPSQTRYPASAPREIEQLTRSFSTNNDKVSEDHEASEQGEPNTASEKDESITPDDTIPPPSGIPDHAKIEKLEKEIKDMKDKVLRAMAEEENVRRIAKRDVDNAKTYANEKFAKTLLEVADNLDYAIMSASGANTDASDPLDNRTGADSAVMLKNLLEGVEATNRGLLKAFAQFGVIKYGAVGDKFDPTIHDALFQVPDDTKEPGTIAQLLQPGYKMKDRVIRAAQVGTAKKA